MLGLIEDLGIVVKNILFARLEISKLSISEIAFGGFFEHFLTGPTLLIY